MSAIEGKSTDAQAKKMDYMKKLIGLMEEYPRMVLVTCDNIGSNHMQRIRSGLRGRGVLLMGKNTLMRKAVRISKETHPEWQDLLPEIWGNIGIVFTKEELTEIEPKLLESRVPATAKAGIVAPQDVVLPAQVTTLEPTKTNFFAALDIATKITRGCVEILADVKLCTEGKKVGSSEAALLQMLDMRPFTYGLKLVSCFDDGCVFPSAFLRKKPEDVYKAFGQGVGNVAALSLVLGHPTLASFPHIIGSGFRNCVSLALATNYEFKQVAAFKSAAPAPVVTQLVVPPVVVVEKPEKVPEPKKPAKKVTTSDEPEFGDIFG
jgi:large subunit ribosomal protein LP0